MNVIVTIFGILIGLYYLGKFSSEGLPSESSKKEVVQGKDKTAVRYPHAKSYKILMKENVSFKGRKRMSYRILSPKARTEEERVQTAMKVAEEMAEIDQAHVIAIFMQFVPNEETMAFTKANIVYAPDGGGLSGDQSWVWKIDVTGVDFPPKYFHAWDYSVKLEDKGFSRSKIQRMVKGKFGLKDKELSSLLEIHSSRRSYKKG